MRRTALRAADEIGLTIDRRPVPEQELNAIQRHCFVCLIFRCDDYLIDHVGFLGDGLKCETAGMFYSRVGRPPPPPPLRLGIWTL